MTILQYAIPVIILAVMALSITAVWMLQNAPFGYEDEDGFHYEERDDD